MMHEPTNPPNSYPTPNQTTKKKTSYPWYPVTYTP